MQSFHYDEKVTACNKSLSRSRVFKALGVTNLLLSNASGGMNPEYKKGDLVLLTDHINLQPGKILCAA